MISLLSLSRLLLAIQASCDLKLRTDPLVLNSLIAELTVFFDDKVLSGGSGSPAGFSSQDLKAAWRVLANPTEGDTSDIRTRRWLYSQLVRLIPDEPGVTGSLEIALEMWERWTAFLYLNKANAWYAALYEQAEWEREALGEAYSLS